MFISTGTPQIEIERIIKELELNSFFKSVLGSPSSKEDHIEYLINNFKINVNKTIFIGDSINDKDAAINKDILFIARIRNKNSALKYEKFKINNFKDLPLLLDNLQK